MNNRLRKTKGFTLAELLIVVAIIGVLVAVSIPIFTGQLEKSRIATDKANVRSAKAAAVAQHLTDGATGVEDYYYNSSGTIQKSADGIKGYGKSTKSDDDGTITGAKTSGGNTPKGGYVKVTIDENAVITAYWEAGETGVDNLPGDEKRGQQINNNNPLNNGDYINNDIDISNSNKVAFSSRTTWEKIRNHGYALIGGEYFYDSGNIYISFAAADNKENENAKMTYTAGMTVDEYYQANKDRLAKITKSDVVLSLEDLKDSSYTYPAGTVIKVPSIEKNPNGTVLSDYYIAVQTISSDNQDSQNVNKKEYWAGVR